MCLLIPVCLYRQPATLAISEGQGEEGSCEANPVVFIFLTWSNIMSKEPCCEGLFFILLILSYGSVWNSCAISVTQSSSHSFQCAEEGRKKKHPFFDVCLWTCGARRGGLWHAALYSTKEGIVHRCLPFFCPLRFCLCIPPVIQGKRDHSRWPVHTLSLCAVTRHNSPAC